MFGGLPLESIHKVAFQAAEPFHCTVNRTRTGRGRVQNHGNAKSVIRLTQPDDPRTRVLKVIRGAAKHFRLQGTRDSLLNEKQPVEKNTENR